MTIGRIAGLGAARSCAVRSARCQLSALTPPACNEGPRPDQGELSGGTARAEGRGVSPQRGERAKSTEAVRKLSEILQTIAQSEIFRDFFASKRSVGSKRRTK